jgi:hypothetical protein
MAQRIDQSDDLGRQPAAGTPNRLSRSPPDAGPVLLHSDDGSIDDDGLKISRQERLNLLPELAHSVE